MVSTNIFVLFASLRMPCGKGRHRVRSHRPPWWSMRQTGWPVSGLNALLLRLVCNLRVFVPRATVADSPTSKLTTSASSCRRRTGNRADVFPWQYGYAAGKADGSAFPKVLGAVIRIACRELWKWREELSVRRTSNLVDLGESRLGTASSATCQRRWQRKRKRM